TAVRAHQVRKKRLARADRELGKPERAPLLQVQQARSEGRGRRVAPEKKERTVAAIDACIGERRVAIKHDAFVRSPPIRLGWHSQDRLDLRREARGQAGVPDGPT